MSDNGHTEVYSRQSPKSGSISAALNQQLSKQGRKTETKRNRERRYGETEVDVPESMAADTVMIEKPDPPMPRRMRSNQTF